jgi:hypothetical protein
MRVATIPLVASDLWCAGNGLDPLAARRPHLEQYIR